MVTQIKACAIHYGRGRSCDESVLDTILVWVEVVAYRYDILLAGDSVHTQ